MLTKSVSRSFAAVVLFCALLSFFKFNHCRLNNWQSPDNYTHACYSDIPALFTERGLDTHTFPYLSATNSIEYPPVIGLGNWLISFITPASNSFRWFFDINALLLVALFVVSAFLVRKIKPQFAYLFPAAPAVIASLYINWDLWAVITALLAIYYFDKRRYEVSAIALGISISTKFFPVVVLLPIVVILYRSGLVKQLQRYITTTLLFWLAINLPIAITYFAGWWRFFKLNLERSADFGSLWYGLNLLGFNTPSLNITYLLLTIGSFISLTVYLLKLKQLPTLAQCAFFAVVLFTTFSKVYSPQYVLWLTPLAVIALTKSRQQIAFWFWQATEIIYHLAIWQYLASYSQATFGLPAGGYALAILLRIIGVSYFTYLLMRDLSAKSTAQMSVISR